MWIRRWDVVKANATDTDISTEQLNLSVKIFCRLSYALKTKKKRKNKFPNFFHSPGFVTEMRH